MEQYEDPNYQNGHDPQSQYLNQYNPQDAAYAPPMYQDGSSIATLTNPQNDIYQFELFLRGLKDDGSGNILKVGDPLMNQLGINSVMASVQSVVHHMNTLSNFDDKGMEFLITGVADDLIKDCMINRVKYQLNRKNRDVVVGNAVRFAYGFAKRAFQEGDRKFWKGAVMEHRYSQESTKPKSSSLNPFKMFSGGK